MTKHKRTILVSLAGILAVGILWAFLIPATYHYEKQVDIIVQPRMAFVFIGELKRWPEWTIWAHRDPDMKTEFSDPAWGVGATYGWDSFWHGSGVLKVTDFAASGSMAYDFTPGAFEPSHWQIRQVDAPRQGARVTWTVDGQWPENRFLRLVAYIWNWRLERDMEKSLDRLKKLAEMHEAYDVFGSWETPKAKPPTPSPEEPSPTKKKSKGKRS